MLHNEGAFLDNVRMEVPVPKLIGGPFISVSLILATARTPGKILNLHNLTTFQPVKQQGFNKTRKQEKGTSLISQTG